MLQHFIKGFLESPFSFGLLSLSSTFMPPYYVFGGWGNLASFYSNPLALVCAVYWIFPFARPVARAVSFALLIGHIYLSFFAGIAPWYIPYVTFFSIFVLSQIIQQAINYIGSLKDKFSQQLLLGFKTIIYSFFSLIFLISLLLTLAASYQLRLQQEIVEDGNRKQIGLWLKANAVSNNDTVFLEPLGYIGFFSQLKMYDYPGLCSPEVLAARNRLKPKESFAKLIVMLKPDWLVLRPREIKDIQNEIPSLLTGGYQAIKVFDVSKRLESYPFLPGIGYLNYDQSFTVFKRRKSQ